MKKIFCVVLLYVCSAWQNLEAQELENSYINIEFREFDISADVVLPIAELELAYGKPVDLNLPDYISSHIQVKSVDGIPWQIDIDNSLLRNPDIPGTIRLRMIFMPATGLSTRELILTSTLINHKILGHRTYVYVKTDWDSGVSRHNPEAIGVVYSTSNQIKIFRGQQNIWRGFLGVFRVGLIHVRDGFDHILFLLILILSTPFLFSSTGRDRYNEAKKSSFHLFGLIGVIALSHMLALLCACIGWLRLPVWIGEILISTTIIISAIHIFWPIMANKEWILAAAFGVFHGLTFYDIILDYGLSASRLVIGVLGLNFGVLVMQLLVVLCLVPWFFIAAESVYYNILKYTLSIVGIALAGFWIHQIVTGETSQLVAAFTSLIERPVGVIAFMAVISLLVRYSPGQSGENHRD